jgi:hypothetical protein
MDVWNNSVGCGQHVAAFAALFSATMLASCLPIAEDTFEVDPAGARIRSATLTLCGRTRPLRWHGRKFSGSHRINCEGSGSIALETEQGETMECLIDYVAPGLEPRHWQFRIRDRSCEYIPESAR